MWKREEKESLRGKIAPSWEGPGNHERGKREPDSHGGSRLKNKIQLEV